MVGVLADAAILTGRLSNLVSVLADAAFLTGNRFRRLPDLLVVLAGAATAAIGNVVFYSRSILSNWASFTGGCFRKWI